MAAFRVALLLVPLVSSKPVSYDADSGQALHVNGIFPKLTATADSGPIRSECGTGALMPWADRLYMVSYLSAPNDGGGTGLYEIDEDMNMVKVANHSSVFANRMLHPPTNSMVIGPYVISANRTIRTISALLDVRIGACAEHLNDPMKMYFLSMDGPLWEVDLQTLETVQLFDMVQVLNMTDSREQPHFKAAHSMSGRLLVASNTFEEYDLTAAAGGGRLAEWHGPGTPWNILERTAFVEIAGRHNMGRVIYAVGWDSMSVLLKVADLGYGSSPSSNQAWRTYRLPKASHAFDHLWQTEWPRIREVETERYLMDAHGMFYEISPLGWAGSTWGVRPISQHLRVVPDFTVFRGMLVLGGNQVSSIGDANLVTGQAQSGLWFGKTDDLWSFGKPQGWGAVFWNSSVVAGQTSDPYLMTGFDKKMLHLRVDSAATASITFVIQIDFMGFAGASTNTFNEPWNDLDVVEVKAGGYKPYNLDGISAHWIRILVTGDGAVTAAFTYS